MKKSYRIKFIYFLVNSDLEDKLTYVLDVGNSQKSTFAYSKAEMNYADYTWSAGWNGYELRAVAKTQFATASHTHAHPKVTTTSWGTSLSIACGEGNVLTHLVLINGGQWFFTVWTPSTGITINAIKNPSSFATINRSGNYLNITTTSEATISVWSY